MSGDPTVPDFDPRLRQDVRRRLFGSSGATPATIDRFELIDRIGTGGMGVVYLARDPRLGRKVALKLLRVAGEDREEADTGHARLLREARALATLSHPHVVVVHEVGETHEQQIYLVMEYIEGRTLGQWCAEQPRDWRAIVEQFIAVGEGLAHAHAAGVVHRDVKPDNVLIGSDGRARIVDFGLAGVEASLPSTHDDGPESTALTKLTATGTVMGTPAYMAPEQHMGAIADARSDQFSLCVAMWEALAGERPFAGNTLPTLRRRVLAGRLRPLPRDHAVPPVIARALHKGLHTDPSARHPSMNDWLDAMRAGLAASPSPPSSRRRRRLVLSAAAVVVIGGGALWWSARRPAPPSAPVTDATEARAEPSVPVWSRITTTQGYGVVEPSVSHDGKRVYYHDRDGWWSISSRGGIPSPMDIGPNLPDAFAPYRPDQWFTVTQGTLQRHDAHGTTSIAAMDYEFSPALHVAPNGQQILDHRWDGGRWTLRRWELEHASPSADLSPIPVEYADHRFTSVAWSPSGDRFAALAITPTDNGAVVLFDARGALLDSWAVGHEGSRPLYSGLTWLPSGSIATFESPDEDQFVVRCDHLDSSGLAATTRSAPVRESLRFGSIFGHDGDQTLLVNRPSHTDDVVLIDLAPTPARGGVMTSDDEARDRWSDWETDDRLMYFTTRFGAPAIVRTTTTTTETQFEELADTDVRWMSADGAGGVVINIEGRGIQHWPAHDAPRTTVIDEPSSRDIGRPRCQEATRCLSLRGGDDGSPMHFAEWSLDSGDIQRRITCADQWDCIESRWSITRDGDGVFVTERQSQVLDVDLRTGAIRRRLPPAPTSTIIQSAIEMDSGDIYVTGMFVGVLTKRDAYLLRRLDDNGHYVTVWSSPSTWIIDARPSPDGRYLVARGLTFHVEAWRLDIGATCQPRR